MLFDTFRQSMIWLTHFLQIPICLPILWSSFLSFSQYPRHAFGTPFSRQQFSPGCKTIKVFQIFQCYSYVFMRNHLVLEWNSSHFTAIELVRFITTFIYAVTSGCNWNTLKNNCATKLVRKTYYNGFDIKVRLIKKQ